MIINLIINTLIFTIILLVLYYTPKFTKSELASKYLLSMRGWYMFAVFILYTVKYLFPSLVAVLNPRSSVESLITFDLVVLAYITIVINSLPWVMRVLFNALDEVLLLYIKRQEVRLILVTFFMYVLSSGNLDYYITEFISRFQNLQLL